MSAPVFFSLNALGTNSFCFLASASAIGSFYSFFSPQVLHLSFQINQAASRLILAKVLAPLLLYRQVFQQIYQQVFQHVLQLRIFLACWSKLNQALPSLA